MSALDVITAGLAKLIPDFVKSDGTIESKIIDVVATYADSQNIELTNSMNDVMQALANQKVTTKEYYRRKAVAFQMGSVLLYDPINQGGYYDPVDPEKQIIVQAYIAGQIPTWTLLVNALDNAGHLRKLTLVELASFKSYFAAFQPLGLEININSLEAAKIYVTNLIIYVRAGTNAGDAVDAIKENLLKHEQTFRTNNVVTLTEIEDLIQQFSGVAAVSLAGEVYAMEQQLDGTTVRTDPKDGIFPLTNGAFTFATDITVDNIKVLD